jgi:sugar lactone lactonase YvrE
MSTNGLYDYDCTLPMPQVSGISEVGNYGPAEDFDIDANGFAVQVFGENLTRRNKVGDISEILTPNVATSASGTRVLKDGNIVIGDASGGEVILVDILTNAPSTLFSAAQWPNGVEVDSDGMLYITDFTGGDVVRFDPYDLANNETIVSGITLPNGIILSPDEQLIYIAGSGGDIFRIDRDAYGEWSSGQVLLSPGGSPQGINIDICGNVYWTDGTSKILRLDVSTGFVDEVADLNSGYLPNLRWGNNIGGWQVDHLYASDRFAEVMYEIPIGIPGKKHIMYL